MSYFERYIVGKTKRYGNPVNRLRLTELTALPPEQTPVRSITLIKGAESGQNRKGLEDGRGSATIYLADADFALALGHIDAGDEVQYVSDPIANSDQAKIRNFNFPELEAPASLAPAQRAAGGRSG